MERHLTRFGFRKFLSVSCVLLMAGMGTAAFAQAPAPPQSQAQGQAQGQTFAPQQLDNLIAPIALYPDPLLGQVLAASTYPVELVEAQQWLQANGNLHGQQLVDAAKQQNWDASVQALVAMPDVLAKLNQDIHWTTDLGNAFLAQPSDVMASVQRMRARAESNGKLQSNQQETVTTQTQNGQQAIEIQPADPQVIYVPTYDPAYVWGAPVGGYYPPLMYPADGWGWYPGFNIGLCFGGWGGWGWGGWGWGPNWYGGNMFIDNSFFNRYGFRNFQGGGALGNSTWMHNPQHRLGVPYASLEVAGRYGSNGAGGRSGSAMARGSNRGALAPQQRLGNKGFEQRGSTSHHSVFGGYQHGGMTRMQSDRGFGSMGAGRIGGFGGGGGMRGGGGGMHGGGGHGGGGRR